MTSRVADRVSVGRAAIASAIAARTGMRLVEYPVSNSSQPNGDTFLAVCSFPPAGYPMETELLPLERIMRGVEERVESDKVADAGEMTLADHMLEEINAFVHDRLLNPILPFEPVTPPVSSIEPINEVYGDVLRNATFAGSVVPSSPRYEKARDLLFGDGEASQALLTYRNYEDRARDAQGDPQRQQRIEAEWIGIGKKLEVEEAFRALREETAAAGFEDERNALKARFRAGEKERIDAAGLSYYRAQLAPIAPLFSETSGPFWQRVEMSADDVVGCVDGSVLAAFELSLGQLQRATERLQRFSFEYIVCDLVRTWLEKSFFSKEFWRIDAGEESLSDGKGGGRLPVLPTRIVFIRGAEAVYRGQTTARFGALDEPETATFKAMRILQVSGSEVAADAAPAKEEEKAMVMGAAEKAGLSASLKLLEREAQRNDDQPVRKARAFMPETQGGRAQKPGKAFAIARMAAMPASDASVVRKASGNSARRRLQALRDRVDSDVLGGTRVTKAFATLQSRMRIDDWLTDSNDRVRDRRRRVRRHPDRNRRPRVRDHRDRDRGNRGRPRRGRQARPAVIEVSGTITATEEQAELLEGVTLGYVWDTNDGNEEPIELTRRSDTRLAFSRTFKAGRSDGAAYEFIIRDAEREELDRRMIELGDDDELTLDWLVSAERLSIELSGRFTPTLHGYGIEIVPPCPNPNGSLNWP